MNYDFITSIAQVPAQQWDDLWQCDYPFIQHGFLSALEQSGATCAESGWQPFHLLIRDSQQRLCAAMVLFIKNHSYGEYVFDWSWAEAYQQNGLDYYPKLINAIPFTPATGPRFIAIDTNAQTALFNALQMQVKSYGFSGFHSLFPSSAHNAVLNLLNHKPPLQQRLGCQFHWFNNDYVNFDDFLSGFASRKRKNIKKERAKVAEHNLHITTTKGTELNHSDWQEFYDLYKRTYLKRSGHSGYLNSECFELIGHALPNQTLLVRAYSQDTEGEGEEVHCQKPIAAALYFYDSQTLYGRYWGATCDLDGLHFECCYYRGIEFAIAQGLQRFDPGAQGEHKIARGFTPVLTQSYHYLSHSEFNRAIKPFLTEEAMHIKAYCQQSRKNLPFKEEQILVEPHYLINPQNDLIKSSF